MTLDELHDRINELYTSDGGAYAATVTARTTNRLYNIHAINAVTQPNGELTAVLIELERSPE